jgi:hypothetical protein
MFNSNLELRAPDSKFEKIYQQLKSNQTIWVFSSLTDPESLAKISL